MLKVDNRTVPHLRPFKDIEIDRPFCVADSTFRKMTGSTAYCYEQNTVLLFQDSVVCRPVEIMLTVEHSLPPSVSQPVDAEEARRKHDAMKMEAVSADKPAEEAPRPLAVAVSGVAPVAAPPSDASGAPLASN